MEKIKRMLSRISKKQWIIIGAIVLIIIIAIILSLNMLFFTSSGIYLSSSRTPL